MITQIRQKARKLCLFLGNDILVVLGYFVLGYFVLGEMVVTGVIVYVWRVFIFFVGAW